MAARKNKSRLGKKNLLGLGEKKFVNFLKAAKKISERAKKVEKHVKKIDSARLKRVRKFLEVSQKNSCKKYQTRREKFTMDEKKCIQHTVRMRPKSNELVERYAEKNRMSFSAAVDDIIFNALSGGANDNSEIDAEKIINAFGEKYNSPIRIILNKTKFIDETTSAIMEMLNEICVRAGYRDVPPYHGDTYKSARAKVKEDMKGD